MNRFLLQAMVIIGAGLVTGLTFALTSPIKLHLDKDPNAQFRDQMPVAPTGPKPATGSTGRPAATGATGTPAPTRVLSSTGTAGATGPTAPVDDLYITIDTAKKIFDSQRAVFIDARPMDEYLKSHIPNAMHLEKDALGGQPPAKVINYLPGMEVVLYCHGELCTDSANVIKRLLALNKGIGPYRIIKDGFPGWEKAGHPMASGPEVGFE